MLFDWFINIQIMILTNYRSINFFDLGPQYASLTVGLANTVSALPGIITPLIISVIVKNKVILLINFDEFSYLIEFFFFFFSSWQQSGMLCSTFRPVWPCSVPFSTPHSVREKSSRGLFRKQTKLQVTGQMNPRRPM